MISDCLSDDSAAHTSHNYSDLEFRVKAEDKREN